jgi:protein HOOK3
MKLEADIDPDYFHGNLPDEDASASGNWIPRWQNWKHIEKEATLYVREECGKLPKLGREMNADLKAIATNGSSQEILKLVKCALLAGMYSPESNERMVEVMQTLGRKVAQPIAGFIGEMEELDQLMSEEVENDRSSEPEAEAAGPLRGPSFERDPELEREEQLIKVLHEKKQVEARLADALAELEESRQKNAKIEDEISESRSTLDRRRGKSIDDKDLAHQQRADRDKEYIAELEIDLSTTRTTIEQQNRQLEKLKSDDTSKQQLRDKLSEATSERDELRQKAKANENLKKKIQTLQEQERENQVLRHDLQEVQEQLQEYDSLQDRCMQLEKAMEENAQTIANGEQEIFDQKTAKRMLEHDLKLMTLKWEQGRDLLVNAQDTIRDLEDRLSDSNPSDRERDFGSLDDELNAGSRQLKASKPRPSVQISSAESVVLQQNLTIANASISRLERRCLDLLQENLGFKAILDDSDPNATRNLHPFQHQVKRVEAITKNFEDARSKAISGLTRIKDLQERLGAAQGKSTNGEALALKSNQERQKYVDEIEADLREERGLLRHALLSPAAMQNENAKERSSNEYKLIRQQLEIVNGAKAPESEGLIKATAIGMTDRIESVRGSLAEKEKILSEQSKEYESLHAQLEAMKSRPAAASPTKEPASPATNKSLKQQLEVLQRENHLIASSWLDITCRLQSNTVHLARRPEGGKSWLARMRTQVNRQQLSRGS